MWIGETFSKLYYVFVTYHGDCSASSVSAICFCMLPIFHIYWISIIFIINAYYCWSFPGRVPGSNCAIVIAIYIYIINRIIYPRISALYQTISLIIGYCYIPTMPRSFQFYIHIILNLLRCVIQKTYLIPTYAFFLAVAIAILPDSFTTLYAVI
jgi:hypothetical protein